MSPLIRRRSRAGDERGSELIELALVLPILLLVLAGIVDFGLLFQRYEVVTNAAREGARVAVLPDYGAGDAESRVRSYLDASGLVGTRSSTSVTYASQTLPSGRTIRTANVTVHYPSEFVYIGQIAKLVGGAGYGTVNLTAASVMRVEGGSGL